MKLITIALISLVALVAVLGLLYVRSGTGQAYYDSYSFLNAKFTGSILNAQGDVIEVFGDGELIGTGQVLGSRYEVSTPDWRNYLVVAFRVDGRPCGSIPVPVILTSAQRTYNGDTQLNLECR